MNASIRALIQELYSLGVMRIAIAGGPRTGKTTLAVNLANKLQLDRDEIVHTDYFKDLEWSRVPESVAYACDQLGSFIVEGVQVARCLRRGLEVDAVVYLSDPRIKCTAHHDAMAKGVETVFREWLRSPGPKPAILYPAKERP